MLHDHKVYQGKDGRWRTYIYEDGKRRMITANTRTKLEKRLAEIYKVDSDISMAELLDDWLQYKALHVTQTTVDWTRREWNRYYKDASISYIPISQLTKIDIDAFIHETIKAQDMSKKEFANFVTILNQLLDYAVDRGVIERNIKRDVKISRKLLKQDIKPDDKSQVFTAEEFSQLRKIALEDFKNDVYPINSLTPLAVIFLFYSGLRVSELVVLRWDDVDDDCLHVRRMYRHETKEIVDRTKGNYGERTIPLVPEALEILDLCKNKQEENNIKTLYIFSMQKGPVSYQGVRKAFYKYSEKAGMKRSAHKARKTFISSLLDAGMNLNSTRQLAGHLDESTTLHNYLFDRSSDDEKRDVMTSALSTQKSPEKSKI